MNIELKPCPFCGGEAVVDGCDDALWVVICKKCYIETSLQSTEQDAIDAWNRRVESTFTPDELDAIRRMFDGRYTALYNALIRKWTEWTYCMENLAGEDFRAGLVLGGQKEFR